MSAAPSKKASPLKRMLAAQLLTALKTSDGAVFVNPGPMTVEKVTKFRTTIGQKAGGARMRLVHNRTAKFALREAGWPAAAEKAFAGPTALVYGGEGATSIARAVTEWARTDKTFVVKGAVAEGEFYDAKGVTALARMPDKNTLRAMLVGAIAGPARGLVSILAAPGASLARVVKARQDAGGFAPDAS